MIEFDGGRIEVLDAHSYAAGTHDTIRATCRASDGAVRWIDVLPGVCCGASRRSS